MHFFKFKVLNNISYFSCNKIDSLRVMSLNTWGLTWFKDLPIPSADEPYNVSQVVAAVKSFGGQQAPNQLLGLLDLLQPQQLAGLFNPSLKKEIRFNAICDFLKFIFSSNSCFIGVKLLRKLFLAFLFYCFLKRKNMWWCVYL